MRGLREAGAANEVVGYLATNEFRLDGFSVKTGAHQYHDVLVFDLPFMSFLNLVRDKGRLRQGTIEVSHRR